MNRPRRSYRSRRRLLTAIKVTALVAALGFVTVMLEEPRLTASPRHTSTSLEQRTNPTASVAEPVSGFRTSPAQSMYPTGSGEAPLNAWAEPSLSASPLPAPSSDNAVSYFPSRFAAPGGDVALQPPTF
jgi:hypothetical protein